MRGIILLIYMPFTLLACRGKIVNPVTDIAWSSLFPITIMGSGVIGSKKDTVNESVGAVCWCKKGLVPVPGVPVGFWEPYLLIDVTRKPFCFVGLGGMSLSKGHNSFGLLAAEGARNAFYHVHVYRYPVLSLLDVFHNMGCFENEHMEVLYLSELDPLWMDESLTQMMTPEVGLAASAKAQLACVGDCMAANLGQPRDELFWCSGCLGSVFPLNGFVMGVGSDVQASALMVHRILYKLHRMGRLKGSVGYDGLCGSYPMPQMRKTQYKMQMVFPSVQRSSSQPLGRSDVIWGQGRSFPIKGEDFCYLVWRRRDCCVLLNATRYTTTMLGKA